MIGQRVGSYVIEAELGRGGMGAVYRARHAMLGRPAAIKILLPQFSASGDIVQRFFNEARAATEIDHLGIVEIYDFGHMETGAAFIVMELLDGESLASRMRKRGHLGVVASLKIVRQMCGPLGAAHDRGIIHRDLKPDNVFIIPDAEVEGGERIKLLDFGIAKITHGDAQQTSTGSIMGTPMYMSPEQCRGVAVDWRSDIYALGCILYELIARRTPFIGEGTGDIMGNHMYQLPPPIAGAHPALWSLIERMMKKAPAERPQSTREVAAAIDQVLAVVVDVPRASEPALASPVAVTAYTGMTPATPPPSGPVAATPAPQGPVPALPASTTLSGSASQAEPAKPPRRRVGLAIGAVVLVGGAAAAAITLANKNETKVASSPPGSAPEPPAIVDAQLAVIDAVPSIASDAAATQITLAIETEPTGASVTVDGKALGTTRLQTTIAAAPHDIVITKRGFKDHKLAITGAEDVRRTIKLVPATTASTPPTPDKGSGKGSAKGSATQETPIGEDGVVTNPYKDAPKK